MSLRRAVPLPARPRAAPPYARAVPQLGETLKANHVALQVHVLRRPAAVPEQAAARERARSALDMLVAACGGACVAPALARGAC